MASYPTDNGTPLFVFHLSGGHVAGSEAEPTRPEVAAYFRPLILKLLAHPEERHHHGIPGMPYWEASMALPERLRHEHTESAYWLTVYDAREATDPSFVGLLALRAEDVDLVSVVIAASGSSDMSLRTVVADSLPAFAWAAYAPGASRTAEGHSQTAPSAGESLPIIAQLLLEAVSV